MVLAKDDDGDTSYTGKLENWYIIWGDGDMKFKPE